MTTKTISKLSYEFHASAIISAYFLGFFITYFILAPFKAYFLDIHTIHYIGTLIICGVFLALPLLVILLIILQFVVTSLEKNTLRWCMWTPIVISGIWFAVEYFLLNHPNVFNIGFFLRRDVLERVLLALLCSGISSALYYLQVKRQLKNLAGADDAARTRSDHG